MKGRHGYYQTRYQASGGGGHPANIAAVLPSQYIEISEWLNNLNLAVLPSNYTLRMNTQNELCVLASEYQALSGSYANEKTVLASEYQALSGSYANEKTVLASQYQALSGSYANEKTVLASQYITLEEE